MSVRHPDQSNSGSAAGQGTTARRRVWWVVASAALAVVVVILVVAGVAASNQSAPGATGISESSTPSGRATAPATPRAVPSPSSAASTPPIVATPAPTEAASGELAPPAAQAPVPLTEPAVAVPGVIFGVGTVEAVDGVARGPGEVGGPSLRFTVTVRNETSDTVSLTSTVVNLFYGPEQSPATELTSSGGAPFPASVAPGATQQGVFVFAVPSDLRDQVRIAVDYAAGVPIVLFEGAAPR